MLKRKSESVKKRMHIFGCDECCYSVVDTEGQII